jgi:hypothetical protein
MGANQSLTLQSGKTCMQLSVRSNVHQGCFSSCFGSKRKANLTNLITLDGFSYFPKQFLDIKQFHSDKAQALDDDEESEMEQKTSAKPRDRSRSPEQVPGAIISE